MLIKSDWAGLNRAGQGVVGKDRVAETSVGELVLTCAVFKICTYNMIMRVGQMYTLNNTFFAVGKKKMFFFLKKKIRMPYINCT